VAVVGCLAATRSPADLFVDFPELLKHGGRSLQSLTLRGVTVERLLKYYDEGLPLKELRLLGCSLLGCSLLGCSLGQNTLSERQHVLAALEQLQDLRALSLITTDVCSVRGLRKHPSLTSLTVGGEKWGSGGEDDEDDDDINSAVGMPDLADIYKIPKLTHLDLSVGLEVGNTKGGFKVTPASYRLIGKCTALTTLEIPVSGGDGVLLSKYLTRCPRLEEIVLHMGRGWDEDGEEVDHDFLCSCPALKSVCSKLGWMDLDQGMDEGQYFRALARKLAKSHPGVLVSLPRVTNHFPEPWDEVPVEEFLGDDSEGDDEDDIDEEDEEW